MKPTTIKIDGKDVEAMPFIDGKWLSRGTEPDRLTMVRPHDSDSRHGRRSFEDSWGAENFNESASGTCIAAALDYFWPGWRERNPGHTREPTP